LKIILASKSPRRKQLLKKILNNFKIIDSKLDENKIKLDTPKKYCLNLAQLKAKNITKRFPDDLIIAADTIVCIKNNILGKPSNYNEAFEMIKSLSNCTHAVYTGVSIISKNNKINVNFVEKTDVTFYNLSDKEIKDYINTDKPFDKAGSYGIQDGSQLFVKSIKGSYENVIGLPISKIYRYFIELNIINL
tara:strand:+ start:613 stop:1185 length:573 start_codon:yes stop_codon:yes gene_type:complete